MYHTKSILIVDSDSNNSMLLRELFQDRYHLAEAKSEQEALHLLRQIQPISAIILDLAAPDIDGFHFLHEMKNDPILRDIPVIAIASADDEELQVLAFDLGVTDVINTPINARTTQLRVRNILEQRDSKLIFTENEIIKLRLTQQEKLLHLAEKDEKTGMDNQQTFFRKVAAKIQTYPKEEFVIVHWDIDRFKVYNDLFGPVEGDRLLHAIGKGFSQNDQLISAHMQADHFVFCIMKRNFEADTISEMIYDWLSSLNPDFDFTPRFGVYYIQDPTMEVSLMCDRALLALLSLKGNFTQRIAFYDEHMRQKLLDEQEMLSEMTIALQTGQFELYLQPQYNYVNGAMIGAEVLVRWIHPQKGLILPAVFLPLLERNGFISRLDEYIWEQACKLLRKWLDRGINPVPISVNLSRIDIYNPHLCEIFDQLLERYQLTPSLLRLEITETAYAENPEQIITVVKTLKEHGFFIEMDDFGSGYSSLNLLKDVPVDLIKLDMRFLDDRTNVQRGRNILYSILQMTRLLCIPVIAEGVETGEQAAFLNEIGCEMAQGFWYHRPMPSKQFEVLLFAREQEESRVALSESLNSETEDMINLTRWMYRRKTDLFELLRDLPLGVILYEATDPPTHIFGNNRFFEIIGMTREKMQADHLTPLAVLPEKARKHIRRTIQKLRHHTEASVDDFRLIRSDGSVEWYRNYVCVVSRHTDVVPVHMVFFEDITREKALEDERTAGYQHWQDEKYRMLMETSNCLFFDYNPLTDLLILSDSSNRIKDQSFMHYLDNLNTNPRLHPDFRENIRRMLEEKHDERITLDYRADYDNGFGECWYRATTTNLKDESGIIYRIVGKVENVESEYEHTAKERNLIEQAERDALTGVYNRQIEQRVEHLLTEAGRGALFMIDLDDFKYVNDLYGHVTGDAVLIHMGVLLKSVFRSSDMIFRSGGDEFMVFMPGAYSAELLAEKASTILRKLETPVPCGDHQTTVSCSIGIALCPDHGVTLQELMLAADRAMYQVKNNAKKNYSFYQGTEGHLVPEPSPLQTNLTRTARQMETVFQAVPGGIALYRYTDHLETLYFTDGVAGMSGMSREEYAQWTTENAMVAVYEADRQQLLENLAKAIATGHDLDEQYRVYHKDGSLIWVHASGRILTNREDGVMIHAVYQEMSRYSRLYYGVLDEMHESICVSDPVTHEILYMNAPACRLAGIEPGSYVGRQCHEVLWQCDSSCSDCPLQHQQANRVTTRERYLPDTGQSFKISSRLMDWNGILVHVEDLEDMTPLPPLKQAENPEAGEQPLAFCKCRLDDYWTVIEANAYFYQMIDCFQEEFAAQDQNRLRTLIPPQEFDFIVSRLERDGIHGSALSVQHRIVTKSGKEIAVDCRILCLRDEKQTNLYCTYSELA